MTEQTCIICGKPLSAPFCTPTNPIHQVGVPPEFAKISNVHFWEILATDEETETQKWRKAAMLI